MGKVEFRKEREPNSYTFLFRHPDTNCPFKDTTIKKSFAAFSANDAQILAENEDIFYDWCRSVFKLEGRVRNNEIS